MENGNYHLEFRLYVGLNDVDLFFHFGPCPTHHQRVKLFMPQFLNPNAPGRLSRLSRISAGICLQTRVHGQQLWGSGLRGFRVLQMPGVLRSFKVAYIDLHKPRETIRDFHELYHLHLPLSPFRETKYCR